MNCRAQRFRHLLGRSRENNAVPVGRRRVNGSPDLLVRIAVLETDCINRAVKTLLQMISPELMTVNPAGVVRTLRIQESRAQRVLLRIGLRAPENIKDAAARRLNIFRLFDKLDIVGICFGHKFIPKLRNPFGEYRIRLVHQALQRINREIDKERIAFCRIFLLAVFRPVNPQKIRVARLDILHDGVRPRVLEILTDQPREFSVRAFFGKKNVI